jgi:hypothetical protein
MLKVNHDYRYESGVDYYTGRVVGDVLSMLGGSGSIVSGIGTSITGGGAITVSSGGTLVLGGGAIVVEGVITGTAQVTYGGVVLEASVKNFGNDLNKLNEHMTNHGKQRTQQRGFSEQKINDVMQNYSHKVYQSGGKTVYAKKMGITMMLL